MVSCPLCSSLFRLEAAHHQTFYTLLCLVLYFQTLWETFLLSSLILPRYWPSPHCPNKKNDSIYPLLKCLKHIHNIHKTYIYIHLTRTCSSWVSYDSSLSVVKYKWETCFLPTGLSWVILSWFEFIRNRQDNIEHNLLIKPSYKWNI